MSEATVGAPAALTLLRRAEHVLFVVLLLVGAGRCVADQDRAVAAVIGALAPILGAGVATVITLVHQGLRRESESRARLVTN